MTRATSCASAPSSAVRSEGVVLHAARVLVGGGMGEFLLEFRMGEARACSRIDACDAAEGGADAHADTRGIALSEHVAGHHFAGCKQIVARHAVEVRCRGMVGLQAEIGEGNAGLKRIG